MEYFIFLSVSTRAKLSLQRKMPSALPPRHTQAPAPPAAASASACLLRRRRGRLRVSLCYCRASTEPLVFASPSSPSLLRSSVAVPVPSSPRHANRGPGDGGGLLVVTVAASAVRPPLLPTLTHLISPSQSSDMTLG
ncbi:Os06g0225400 [Oryza sativa Japonica Group]|uniref:Os06g0225400 protein n=1 Tax=Oryza sativa subsp. japonica TaxID=39947 RepID=A0A0P0WU73_ORYSJ|nr:hypothetical protein EE612_032811 [Oryza sativa]BAS96864.1 Os06g0225400 [Oryza sativa Japonica Group]